MQKATCIIPRAHNSLHDYTVDCYTGILCTVIAGPRKYGALGARKYTTDTRWGKIDQDTTHCELEVTKTSLPIQCLGIAAEEYCSKTSTVTSSATVPLAPYKHTTLVLSSQTARIHDAQGFFEILWCFSGEWWRSSCKSAIANAFRPLPSLNFWPQLIQHWRKSALKCWR